MDIWGFLLSLVNVKEVAMLICLLLGNMATGALAGAVTNTFDWGKLSDIWKRMAWMFGAYLVAAAIAQTLINLGYGSNWDMIRTGALGVLTLKLINYILANLAEMGFPVPSSLNKVPVVSHVISGVGKVVGAPAKMLKKPIAEAKK